jgi:DNA modification methylase
VSALVRANAIRIPLRDESVDLVVTSPPYFALRSYRDAGDHYNGQIGSEPTPQAFLEALWAVLSECWRVLKPSGSCWVNLGDKRARSGGHNNSGISSKSTLSGNGHVGGVGKAGPQKIKATLRNAPDRYNQAAFGRPKSKMLLPHRFAIGCEDGLADPEGKGWIVRQDVVWSKLNGLPESVTDRCRDSHEYLFHLTKSEQYFSAVDEVREAYTPGTEARYAAGFGQTKRQNGNQLTKGYDDSDGGPAAQNPFGKLPGSVWPIASEPLIVPEAVQQHYDLPDHFAAFPQELPRRIILGWSPSGICIACGEGRRPVVEKEYQPTQGETTRRRGLMDGTADHSPLMGATGHVVGNTTATITGYACACPDTSAPTRPAIVLDPFAGTGTTCGVARALGRYGVGLDLSADYLRLARWRVFESGHFAKTANRTNRERQGVLLTEEVMEASA